MFRRQNNNNKQQPGGKGPVNEIREEQEAEDALIKIGNEAAGTLAELPNPNSNEANNAIIDEDPLAHYKSQDLRDGPDHNNPNAEDDPLAHYKDQDLRDGLEQNDRIKNIINEIKPALAENEGKKGEKSGKSAVKSSAARAAAPRRDEDLTQVDQSMEPAAGWDFVAEKLPTRKKQNILSKIGSWLAYYSGKTIGKIGGILGWIGKSIYDFIRPGPGTFGGSIKRLRGSSRFQEKGDRNLIPGWDGAKFENEEGPADEVNADFRRVPEIWAWPIATKATEGKDEYRDAKPLEPVISVYISQGDDKYTVTNNNSTGHSGIGVEFSRYSAMAGRWQRYNLRFGYYMKGGGSAMSKVAITSYNNATIPGQVLDEKNEGYDISRSFAAKPKQVSDVLRAAESYADRGGYNAYTRNCTTFAKEMIVDIAQIKGASSVFAKDEVYLQSGADAKMFAAGAMAPIVKADMENTYEKIGHKDDLSYQNFGNKMLSREEYERYKDSLKLWSSQRTEADSPNAVAENLKRSEGGKSGTIGIQVPVRDGNKSIKNAPMSVVIMQIGALLSQLKNTLTEITPADKLAANEMKDLLKDLTGQDISVKLTTLMPQMDDELIKQKSKQSNLVEARTLMTDTIKKLNTLLFKYYRNDKRVQKKVLPAINLLNHGINFVDDAYIKTEKKDLTDGNGELSDIQKGFFGSTYKFNYNGKSVNLSPSQYEALLQIYKTPQKALEQYSRYQELMEKYRDKNMSEPEIKELEKFFRIQNLFLDFQKAHRYMITKDKFNQQDVDYAFSLAKKERQGGVDSTMFEAQSADDPTMARMKNPNASAAGVYQMMIMKDVFGEMKERFKKKFEGGYNLRSMLQWIEDDAADCVTGHKKELTTIIRGLKHTTDNPDEDRLEAGFTDLLTKWIHQLFRKEKDDGQYNLMVQVLTKRNGKTMSEVLKVISEVMKENEGNQ